MKLFARGCGLSQLPYTARAEDLTIRDRFDIEAHAASCPECTAPLRDAQSVVPQQPRSVIHEYFLKQPPTDEINYFRWLRLNQTESPKVVSDPVRFPVGGRYDFDLVEPVRAPTASPR